MFFSYCFDFSRLRFKVIWVVGSFVLDYFKDSGLFTFLFIVILEVVLSEFWGSMVIIVIR